MIDTGRARQFVARGCAGCLLLIGLLAASPAVAAASSTAAVPTPAATDPVPPTLPPPSGANGGLAPAASPTPASAATTAPTADPTAAPQGTAIVAPLAPPTPTGTAAGTPSQPPPSPTARPATATATRAQTPTTASTATSQPTGTPTGTPGANPASIDLANLVILDDPGIGGDATIARIATHHYGEQFRPDGIAWTGWCEMFVGNVLAEAGIAHPRYGTALDDAVNGPLYRGHAPAGSLVFFDQRADPNGHVGVALGDGTMLSALSTGVVRSAYEGWPSYLGWRPFGATTPQGAPFMVGPLLMPVETDALEMPPWPDQPEWYAPPPYLPPHTAMK